MARVPEILGACDERFAPVRDALADNFRAPRRAGRRRCDRRRRRARSSTSGPGGWTPRAHAAVAARHARGRLLGRQGDGGAVRPAPGGARRGRPRRPRGALLARVRGSREGRGHGAHAALPPRRPARGPARAPGRGDLRLGPDGRRARRGGAVVGARLDARLPREHARVPGRRDRPARRAATSIGAFFRREVAEPLGADFHFGFGAEEDHRVAEYTFGSASRVGPAIRAPPTRSGSSC